MHPFTAVIIGWMMFVGGVLATFWADYQMVMLAPAGVALMLLGTITERLNALCKKLQVPEEGQPDKTN